MFNLFKKKSPVEKLNIRYKKLMQEVHALSKTDRTASDAKYAEAEKILKEIESLQSK